MIDNITTIKIGKSEFNFKDMDSKGEKILKEILQNKSESTDGYLSLADVLNAVEESNQLLEKDNPKK